MDITLLVIARPLQRASKPKAAKAGDIISVSALQAGRSFNPRCDFIHVTGVPNADIQRYRDLLKADVREPDHLDDSDPTDPSPGVVQGDLIHKREWSIDESLIMTNRLKAYRRDHELTINWTDLKAICLSRTKLRAISDRDV